MRNFLSYEYGDVDNEALFDTIKTNIPDLLSVTRKMLSDMENNGNTLTPLRATAEP